jgi:outer membrane protein TolC
MEIIIQIENWKMGSHHEMINRKGRKKMRKRISIFLMIGLLWGGMSVYPKEESQKKVVLDDLIEKALTQNPVVKASFSEWQSALEKVPQVKSLPDPMLSYARFGQNIETRLGPQRNKISLSQKIPFFGKLSLKGEIAQKGASVLEEQYSRVRADVILKVKEAYYSLYRFDRAIQISNQEKEVLRRLSRIAQKKYETGKASQQDVLKAQLEISRVEDKILTLSQAQKAVKAGLNALLNRSPETPIGEVEEPPLAPFDVDKEGLYQLAEKERPELRRAQRLVVKNEASLKLAKKNYYPDFKLMLDYIDIGAGTTTLPGDGRNAWMGSIGINIPIWRSKLRAAEAEASLQLKASEESYQNMKNQTHSKIDELYHEVKTNEEQIALYKYSLLPQAEQAFKASEVGYLAGKVDFLNLLDSERMVLTVKMGYHKSISDAGKSLARLERIVGQDFLSRGTVNQNKKSRDKKRRQTR